MKQSKFNGEIPTPKKYKKSLKLIEKFEAMTSDERKAYLDILEKEIMKIKNYSDYLDKKNNTETPEGERHLFNSLKNAGEIGVRGALLSMTYAQDEAQMIESAIIGGFATGGTYPLGEYISDEIKTKVYAEKLDKLLEEWVACSYVENTACPEREI